jgi:hypothetical protein
MYVLIVVLAQEYVPKIFGLRTAMDNINSIMTIAIAVANVRRFVL